jgi:hypothetical protein
MRREVIQHRASPRALQGVRSHAAAQRYVPPPMNIAFFGDEPDRIALASFGETRVKPLRSPDRGAARCNPNVEGAR